MSDIAVADLTAAQWCAGALALLREYELNCNDVELFNVGYLIPMIELFEVDAESGLDKAARWFDELSQLVESNIVQDKMSDEDAERVRTILTKIDR